MEGACARALVVAAFLVDGVHTTLDLGRLEAAFAVAVHVETALATISRMQLAVLLEVRDKLVRTTQA